MGRSLTARVATGPTEIAGCAWGLREALETKGVEADVVLWSPSPFRYHSGRVLSRSERIAFGAAAPLRHGVFHYQYGSTWARFVDAYWARLWGRTLVSRYHGDDCRLHSVATRLFPARARVVDPGREPQVRRRLRRLGRICHAALVADLELAAYVRPFYRRVYVTPLSLLPASSERAPQRAGAPVVLHASSDPDVKGTATITEAVRSVAQRVPLEYRLLVNEPHERVQRELAQADVVVDQLNSVTSGVFALEALRLGVPVLGELDPAALAPYQHDLPVVAVTTATLEHELEGLLRDGERRRHLGARGRDYVASVYSPDRIGRTMLAIYEHARRSEPGVYEATGDGITRLE